MVLLGDPFKYSGEEHTTDSARVKSKARRCDAKQAQKS